MKLCIVQFGHWCTREKEAKGVIKRKDGTKYDSLFAEETSKVILSNLLFHTKEIGAYRGLVTCPMSPNDLMAHPGVESSLLFNKPMFLCCYDSWPLLS